MDTARPRTARRARRGAPIEALAVATALALASCTAEPTTEPADDSAASDTGADAAPTDGVNSWAQGYSAHLVVRGGIADGVVLDVSRDLFDIPTAFSFGSTHYTHGEVTFAVADTFTVQSPDSKGKLVETPIEIGLNFGFVVGSSVNDVDTDKAGTYAFSCQPPSIRVFFENSQYRSTCDGLVGNVVVTDYANTTGGRMAGTFKGRIQAVYPSASYPDDCDPAQNAQTCKKPDRYIEIEGVFGFTLPEKADGGG
jgi:hypothetical protein